MTAEAASRKALASRRQRPKCGKAMSASTSIFDAVCPQDGKGAGLVLPLCNSYAMKRHLAEIIEMVSPGKHAVPLSQATRACGVRRTAEMGAWVQIIAWLR